MDLREWTTSAAPKSSAGDSPGGCDPGEKTNNNKDEYPLERTLGTISDALRPFPEARAAVVEALRRQNAREVRP